ncbi:hypothetical protein I4U23_004050 [Adineta vaga]|nr:hypothetical protein I4U23_004050 [Adineta vaga]
MNNSTNSDTSSNLENTLYGIAEYNMIVGGLFILIAGNIAYASDNPSHARDYICYYFGSIATNTGYQLTKSVRGQCKGSGFAEKKFQVVLIFMTCLSTYTGTELVTGVDFGRFETLVDLSGNRGTFLAQILQHYENIRHGFVFDLPQCMIPQADAYILKYLLHVFDDEICVATLSSIRKANENHSDSSLTIFIVEHIILNDYAYSAARERTEQEYQVILEKAGFQLKKLYPLQAPDSIIEATFIK